MSGFTQTLRIAHSQRTEKGRMLGVLLRPLVYYDGDTLEGSKNVYTVPAGFVTDGTSSPAVTWPWFPPWGSTSAAAVLHDYEYLVGRGLKRPRREIDRRFLDAQIVLGEGAFKARLAYTTVRLGGNCAYSREMEVYYRRVMTVLGSLDPLRDNDLIDLIRTSEVHRNIILGD